MALIDCPECRRIVSDKAEICPNCGINIQSEIQTKIKTEQPANSSATSATLLFGGLLLLAITIGAIASGSDPSSENNDYVKEATPTSAQSKQDSIAELKRIDNIKKVTAIEEAKFKKTKAGKIWKKHRDWSKEDCKLIAKNMIWIGMEYEMLTYERGLPDNVNTSDYGSGVEYQACWNDYDSSCFYFREDHIIRSYN